MTEIEEILLDMDGVLVDFVRGAIEVHDLKISVEDMYQNGLGSHDIVSVLDMHAPAFWKPMDFEFWSKLEWMPDGQEILDHVESVFGRERITLWTSPSANYGCMDGKKRWVEQHMPRHYKHNIVFGSKKHLGARPDTILIDDSDSNVDKFRKRGGLVVMPPRIWNSDHPLRDRTLDVVKERIAFITNQ